MLQLLARPVLQILLEVYVTATSEACVTDIVEVYVTATSEACVTDIVGGICYSY